MVLSIYSKRFLSIFKINKKMKVKPDFVTSNKKINKENDKIDDNTDDRNGDNINDNYHDNTNGKNEINNDDKI